MKATLNSFVNLAEERKSNNYQIFHEFLIKMIPLEFRARIDNESFKKIFNLITSKDRDSTFSAITNIFPNSLQIGKKDFSDLLSFIETLSSPFDSNNENSKPNNNLFSFEIIKSILNLDSAAYCSNIAKIFRLKFKQSTITERVLQSFLRLVTEGEDYEDFIKFSGLSSLHIESILFSIKLLLIRTGRGLKSDVNFHKNLLDLWSKKLEIDSDQLSFFIKFLTLDLTFDDLSDFFVSFRLDKILKRDAFLQLLSLIFEPSFEKQNLQMKSEFLESREKILKVRSIKKLLFIKSPFIFLK